jgi:hypothetical protein
MERDKLGGLRVHTKHNIKWILYNKIQWRAFVTAAMKLRRLLWVRISAGEYCTLHVRGPERDYCHGRIQEGNHLYGGNTFVGQI